MMSVSNSVRDILNYHNMWREEFVSHLLFMFVAYDAHGGSYIKVYVFFKAYIYNYVPFLSFISRCINQMLNYEIIISIHAEVSHQFYIISDII